VPTEPPALLPGRSAGQLFNRSLVVAAGIVVAVLASVELLESVGSTLAGVAAPALGLIGFAAIMLTQRKVGARKLEELEQGYTTLTLQFGGFWLGEPRRWPGFWHRMPWDYSGVWVLDGSTGAVISEPSPDSDPPGFYPSPNRHGALELWTGVVWSGVYRKPT
jgi:hypothetical protein